MTIHCHSRGWRFAPLGLALAVSCALGAQSRPDAPALDDASSERATSERAGDASNSDASNSIDPVDASSRLDGLVLKLRDKSSLQRVQTLEAIDASAAIMADTVNSILLDALDDHDPLVGETALRGLLVRDDEQVLEVREKQLARYPGQTSQLARVRLAARNGDVSALRKFMRTGDALVQESAFEGLASNDTDAAIDLLRKEFQDPASLYRLQTLELFVRSAYTNSSATLMPILELAGKDADPRIRDRGQQLLTQKRAETAEKDPTG